METSIISPGLGGGRGMVEGERGAVVRAGECTGGEDGLEDISPERAISYDG